LAVRFDDIEIDDHIVDKIESKHGVKLYEVEEVCYSPGARLRRGRAGLYRLFGPTDGGRLLVVVLAEKGPNVWRVVTARRMTDAERRLYGRKTGA
jgi:uncharacterized DUF497 family protein